MEKKMILLVDDEKDLVSTIKMRLDHYGYDIIAAYDGQEALEKVRNKKPDLIILDLMLPKIDGYKVCSMLKLDEKYKDVPIIIFTARAQESDRKLALECGADDYIVKPFEPQILLDKIKVLLNK